MIYIQGHPVLEESEQTDERTDSMNNEVPNATDKEIFFAKERYKLHQTTPDEGVSVEILKKYFFRKYGF
jgi:hypothetical protein